MIKDLISYEWKFLEQKKQGWFYSPGNEAARAIANNEKKYHSWLSEDQIAELLTKTER